MSVNIRNAPGRLLGIGLAAAAALSCTATWAAASSAVNGPRPAPAVRAAAQPANGFGTVGYYEMCNGQGAANQVAPIEAAGLTAVSINDLSSAELATVDVLFVDNCDNGGYGSEYVAHLAEVEAFVRGGGALVLHDRHVASAASIVPGGSGINFVRDFAEGTDINIQDDTTLVTHGPGGDLTNASLDGGNYSNHGYATNLPAGADLILSATTPSHAVTFSYPLDAGFVVYSTIPLDFYLGGSSAFKTIYAPNVIAYAFSLTNRVDTVLTALQGKVMRNGDVKVSALLETVPEPPMPDAAAQQVGGSPVPNKTIYFYAANGMALCQGVTGASGETGAAAVTTTPGVASCTVPISVIKRSKALAQSLFVKGYYAKFNGAPGYAPSTSGIAKVR